MAQYRGCMNIQGGKEVTKLGRKNTGLIVDIDGCDSGVKVQATYNEAQKRDEFFVYINGGSSGVMHNRPIGTVYLEDGEVEFHPVKEETE